MSPSGESPLTLSPLAVGCPKTLFTTRQFLAVPPVIGRVRLGIPFDDLMSPRLCFCTTSLQSAAVCQPLPLHSAVQMSAFIVLKTLCPGYPGFSVIFATLRSCMSQYRGTLFRGSRSFVKSSFLRLCHTVVLITSLVHPVLSPRRGRPSVTFLP